MKRLVVAGAVLALFLVGCGGGGGDDTDPLAGGADSTAPHDHAGHETSTCSPSGTSLSIVAQNTAFNTDCLAAPANQAFTVTFENKDQVAHNLTILESHSASEAMFDAEIIPPGTKTLNVGALKPGTFAFHCKIHPGQMSGTFIVK